MLNIQCSDLEQRLVKASFINEQQDGESGPPAVQVFRDSGLETPVPPE